MRLSVPATPLSANALKIIDIRKPRDAQYVECKKPPNLKNSYLDEREGGLTFG